MSSPSKIAAALAEKSEPDEVSFEDTFPGKEPETAKPDSGDQADILDSGDAEVPPEPSEQPDAGEPARAEGSEPAPDQEAEFAPALLDRARELGISTEEARSYGRPEILERSLDALDRKLGEFALGKAQPAVAPPAAPPPIEAESPSFKLDLDEMAEDGFDPALVKVNKGLKSLHEHYETRVAQLEGVVRQLSGQLQQGTAQTSEQQFDQLITDLGDEYAESFGSGSGRDLPTNGQQLANRVKLWQEIGTLKAGYAATKRRAPSDRVLFKRALAGAFGTQTETIAKQRLDTQLRDRQGQFISAPSSRKVPAAGTPVERATAAVRDKLRDLGVEDDY